MILALPLSTDKGRRFSHSVCVRHGPVRSRHQEGTRHARELLEGTHVKNKVEAAEVGRESHYIAVWVCERKGWRKFWSGRFFRLHRHSNTFSAELSKRALGEPLSKRCPFEKSHVAMTHGNVLALALPLCLVTDCD